MYDSADTKRLSKELLQRASEGETITVQCLDKEDTEKTFNRLNVQRHRQTIKNVKINYNLVTFVLEIVQKGPVMSGNPDKRQMSENQDKTESPKIRTKRPRTKLQAAPVEAYAEVAAAAGVDPQALHDFAEETAEAINAMGGLEAANASARPWSEVKAELGLESSIRDQGELGAATAIATTAALEAATPSAQPKVSQRASRRTARAEQAPAAPTPKYAGSRPPTPDLWEGKRLREKGKCFHCGGELVVARDGHYHQRVFEESAAKAYPVDLCCHCVSHKVA